MAENPNTATWWHGAVIYQIYPRSFLDTSGNGVGDLPGITSKLSYVADLGVDAVWLSPFFRSPMRDFGYDVSDYRDVDPMFGTLADFDELIAKADQLGLAVIIDQVYSHSSDQHPWFASSASGRTGPEADWYVWADAKPDGSPPNNWQSIFGGSSWTWSSQRGQYYLHNFLSSQPDLNLHNPAVQEEVFDTARFWLDRGVKGFRLDALHCSMHDRGLRDNPPRPVEGREIDRTYDLQWHQYDHAQPEMLPFLERFRTVTEAYGAIFSVAEVGADDALSVMRDYTARGRLQSAYSFQFLWAPTITADLVRQGVRPWLDGDKQQHWPSWAFSNHDAVRTVSRWNVPVPVEQRARLFGLLLLSLRGNIFVYQGEELGLPQADVPFERLRDPEALANWPKTLGRDGARTPMPWSLSGAAQGFTAGDPWLPSQEAYRDLSVQAQIDDPDSVLSFFRRLIGLRRDSRTLREGSMRFLSEEPDLLIFERTIDEERVVAAFNLSNDDVETDGFPGEVVAMAGHVKTHRDRLRFSPWSGILMEEQAP